MTFDQAQSSRLGQRVPIESPGVRSFSGSDLPEVAYPGQMIYRSDTQQLQIYDEQVGAWKTVSAGSTSGGNFTFVGPDVPTSINIGDTWINDGDNHKLYVAREVGANAIATGEWELTQDSWGAYQAAQAAADAAANAQQTANDAVASYVTEYAVNSSETVAPTTGWSTATPTRTPGTFIWTRVEVTYGNGETATTNPALLTGNTGAQGSQGVPGTPGADGTTHYTWIKYADTPTTGMADDPTGKTYLGIAVNQTSSTESNNYSDYTWSLIKGAQGIQGPAGTNGQPTYTWVKYATDASGTGLSDDPTGKSYIGLAYNKTTAVESTTASDYTWSLFLGPQGAQGLQGPQGSQGIAGPAGADGVTHYTWLKYADSPTTGMSDSPTGKTYMGLAYNKTTATESTTYSDYSWSLIQGPQGNQGIQGPAGTNGQPTYTWIKYAPNGSPSSAQMSDTPGTNTYIGLAFNKTTATESTVPTDYQWSLIQGPQGSTGVSVTSVMPYFAQLATGSAAPAQPTVTAPPAPWVATEPGYVAGTELWEVSRVGYSDGSFAYTTVVKSSSYAAAVNAQTTADSKIKSFYSDTAPWANGSTTHALDAGDQWYDTSNGNIVRYWDATNKIWTSLLLGQGALNQDSVTSYQLAGDAVSPGFLLTGAIQLGNISIDATDGIREILTNPGTFIIPADGSTPTITAKLTAETLSTTGQSNIGAPATLADTMTLNLAGVPTPAKPTLAISYRPVTPGTTINNAAGLTENNATPGAGTAWVTSGTDLSGTYTPYLYEVNKTTGAVTSHQITNMPGSYYQALGVVRIGAYYYVLIDNSSVVSNGGQYIAKVDASTYAVVGTPWGGNATLPKVNQNTTTVLGTDGTNLILAYQRGTDYKGVINVWSPDGATHSVTNLVTSIAFATNGGLWGIAKATADFGQSCYAIQSGGQVYVFDSTGAQQTTLTWTAYDSYATNSGNKTKGLYYDGTHFIEMSKSTNAVVTYSNHAATETVTAVGTVTDGGAETAASPSSSSISWLRRAWLQATLPAYPTAPSGLFGKLYVGVGTGAITRYLQTVSPAFSSTTLVGYVDSKTATGNTAPAAQVGSFTAGGAGKIAASLNGPFSIDGNSNGSIGTGTFRDSITALINSLTHPEWSVSANRNSDTLTLGASSNNVLNWNNTVTDPSNILATSTFTVPVGGAGTWRMMINVWWQGDNTGRRSIWINKNDNTGAGILAQATNDPPATGSPSARQFLAWEGRLAAGDVLRAYSFHTSGLSGGLAIQSGSWCSFEWVRA